MTLVGMRLDTDPEWTVLPGAYWKDKRGHWMAYTPDGRFADLSGHKVAEHPDGRITVSPSILVIGHTGDWHGHLIYGTWKDC